MQYSTLILGFFIVFFGLYTTVMTFKSPQELIKLKYMRAKLGLKAGTIVHSIAYVVIPFLFGYFVLKAGFDGITITEFITGQKTINR